MNSRYLERRVESTRREIEEINDVIVSLVGGIEELENKNDDLNREINKLQDEINELNNKIK